MLYSAPVTSPALTISERSEFRRRLLRWFDTQQRKLPWRAASAGPYRVWISEVMLQQTRVAVVISYYERFLQRFPHVTALARAREEDVLTLWSGLGYYRRARMLHAAARVITKRMGGRFPTSEAALRELPGIGRYTAAAIASIAFGARAAVVDGNVERVLRRLGGAGSADLWATANHLISPRRPGDFNQAMMELGATICTPRGPQCEICPIRKWCATQGELVTSTRVERVRKVRRVALACRADSICLVKRSVRETLMPGMWELPETSSRKQPLFTLKHCITTTDYLIHVYETPVQCKGEWIKLRRLRSLPLTGLTRKVLRRIEMIR